MITRKRLFPPAARGGEMLWSSGAAGVTALLFAVAHAVSPTTPWIFIPWVASLLIWGLPHGAIDHELIEAMWRRPGIARPLALIVLLYAFVVAAGLVAWWVVPKVMFLAFIMVTLFHWGTADLWWSWHRDPAAFPTFGRRLVFALLRGALPMFLPLVAHPDVYRRTAEAACGAFGTVTNFGWLDHPGIRITAAAICLALGAADWAAAVPSRTRPVNRAESIALAAGFLSLNPVLSIGIYFTCWHGLRHVLRLTADSPLPPPARLRFFARRAMPMTVISLVALAALFFWGRAPTRVDSLLGIYLALIASLTLPHAVVVTVMDLREGLWHPPNCIQEK